MSGAAARVAVASAAAALLVVVYWESLRGYLRDQHYQEHFVYLWVFLAVALWRTLKGPFRAATGVATARERAGLALAIVSYSLHAASLAVGSSTGMRTSLVAFLTGVAVLAVPRWTIRRCLLHGLLMQLCFGIPYTVYFPLTSRLQWGVASVMALPARLGVLDYTVESNVIYFPHYALTITPDCSGLGQLLTFSGIAALGVLSSAAQGWRTVRVFAAAAVLAWLSNLARVAFFASMVGVGWTWAVDRERWHAGLGLVVFMPFVLALVAVILRSHVSLAQAPPPPPLPAGRLPLALLVAPLCATHFVLGSADESPPPEPAYFAALETPPGHVLTMRAPTEASDRKAYVTPWLLNARFEDVEGRTFDLLHYTTRSRSHLAVHKIAACLFAPGQTVRYGSPVEIDGRRWWPVSLEQRDAAHSTHVYYSFRVDGKRCDDSLSTQLEVFRRRLLGRPIEVKLDRVVLRGEAPETPTDYELELLTWLGRLTE